MTEEPTRCALCGRDPATGRGFITTTKDHVTLRFCHGDGDPSPTCWEQGARAAAEVARLELRRLTRGLGPTRRDG